MPVRQPRTTKRIGHKEVEGGPQRRPVRRRDKAHALHRWGIVLAGGDGVRIRGLTRLICGDDRPKQFCQLLGDSTLLAQTRRRAEKSIPPEQVLYALTRAHQDYYLAELQDRPSQRIVQPCNRGTAPAILYTLLRVAHMDPDATVAVLPCDHYYSEESLFTRSLESAFEAAAARPQSVVLLGATPSGPEIEYGWIEVGAAVREAHSALFRVRGFREKPSRAIAESLFRKGCLWNTFVMVGHVQAFLQMAGNTVPGLLEVFRSKEPSKPASGETRIANSLYDWVTPSDFSRQVLSLQAHRLVTLRLDDIGWNDLGDPNRVLATLLAAETEPPQWVRLWQATREVGAHRSSTAVA